MFDGKVDDTNILLALCAMEHMGNILRDQICEMCVCVIVSYIYMNCEWELFLQCYDFLMIFVCAFICPGISETVDRT